MSSRLAVRTVLAAGLVAAALAGPAVPAQAQSVWSPPQQLGTSSPAAGTDARARTFLSADGTRAVAVWEQPADVLVQAAAWTASGGWATPQGFDGRIAEAAASADARHAVLSWSSYDNANDVFRVLLSTWDGTTWSTPVEVAAANAVPGPVTMSGDGSTAFVAFYDASDALHVSRWTGGAGLQPVAAPAFVPSSTAFELSADGSTGLSVGIDTSTDPEHIALVAQFWGGSAWSAPFTLTDTGVDGQAPRAALSADGTSALVAWTRPSADAIAPDEELSRHWDGASWTAAQPITAHGFGSLASDTVVSRAAYVVDTGSGIAVSSWAGSSWTTTSLPGTDATDSVPVAAMSADGSSVAVGWSAGSPAGYTVARRTGTTWSSALIEAGVVGPSPSLALSGNGTAAMTLWQSACADLCVSAAALTPVPLVRTSGPTVTGTARVGSVLTCTVGYTGADTVTYSWKRNGAAIAGASTRTLRLGAADLGKRLTCTSGATGAGATAAPVTSAASGVVATGPALRATTKPKVGGTRTVGRTLRVTHGTWAPAAATYRYQWLRDGKAIKGATKSRYKLTSKAKRHKISVRVTARAPGYADGRVTTTRLRIR